MTSVMRTCSVPVRLTILVAVPVIPTIVHVRTGEGTPEDGAHLARGVVGQASVVGRPLVDEGEDAGTVVRVVVVPVVAVHLVGGAG